MATGPANFGHRMHFTTAFIVASGFAAVLPTAQIIADTTNGAVDVISVAQYGGTGGLIVSLVVAIRMLWVERQEAEKRMIEDRKSMQALLSDERKAHRAEINEMRSRHQLDLQEQTDRFIDELQRQIAAAQKQERAISDEKYEQSDTDTE